MERRTLTITIPLPRPGRVWEWTKSIALCLLVWAVLDVVDRALGFHLGLEDGWRTHVHAMVTIAAGRILAAIPLPPR